MMKARQVVVPAVLNRSILFGGFVAVCLAAFGAAVLDSTGAANLKFAAAALPPSPKAAEAALPPPLDNPVVIVEDVATPPAESVPAAVAETVPVVEPRQPVAEPRETITEPREIAPHEAVADSHEPAAESHEPVVKLASADPTDMLPAETTRLEPAASDTPSSTSANDEPKDNRKDIVGSVEVLDECLVVERCVDRYLWALYQRTPKEDSIKEHEQRRVAVKRRGKMVMVTRTFTKLVDEDFGWKDPKAAEHAGMPLMDYVIGGMDKSFKLKLFHTLLAADAAGLSPGITSAFRDDYRQSIASGLKAASNRSYHGGSSRGGYGHGLAADIVSTKGANRAQRWTSTEVLWKWIDANGKALGIGRPYLDRDPPHVGPVDGQEYTSRRGGDTVRNASAAAKTKEVKARSVKAKRMAMARFERNAQKRSAQKSARIAKGRTI
jgi:hypothetical protein